MLYKEALQYENLKKIYVTHIDQDYECDTFFPEIPDDFTLESDTVWFSENNINYKYETYVVKDIEEEQIEANPGLYFAK